jgi:hypothetical protein
MPDPGLPAVPEENRRQKKTGDIHDKDLSRENRNLPALGRVS